MLTVNSSLLFLCRCLSIHADFIPAPLINIYYNAATTNARAAPATAHPALPVTWDMPAVLVLLAALADEAAEPPVVPAAVALLDEGVVV
jgi:hypothetical protein